MAARAMARALGRVHCAGSAPRRAIATTSVRSWTTSEERPALVTTPIFYVNAAPHVGHLHTVVLSDALARWQRMAGRTAVLVTGTDEHGLKIQQAAQRAGKPAQQFCDDVAADFARLVPTAGIAVADFVRTTQPRHRAAVEHLWRELVRRGHIYKGEHEGWYSVPDETFVPEGQTEVRVDAQGRSVRVSLESGHAVEWVKEENYKFRLSAFADRLRAWLVADPTVVQPPSRYREVLSWLDKGLVDLSVSRLTERVQWGIPVPDDPAHTVYVWLDALTNYLTVTGYPWTADTSTSDRRTWFPPAYQVIGKDILRFHCVYWPAFLMAADLPLPSRFIAHAHWTVEGQKMSKSIGNVVDPFALVGTYGVDAVRLFLLREAGLADDADFSYEALRLRANHDLADQLGNLLSRASAPSLLPAQTWPAPAADLHASDRAVLDTLASLPSAVGAAYALGDFAGGLETLFRAVADANRYFSDEKPWTLRARQTDADSRRLDTIVHVALAAVRTAAGLLQPVVPAGAARALARLGDAQLTVADLDPARLHALPGRPLGAPTTAGLFPRLAADVAKPSPTRAPPRV